MTGGDRVGDRYVLGTRLGTGGTGEVWAAVDETLHRDVAVKLVGPDVEPDRLAREARAAARISHPNVVGVHDAGAHDGRAFLVMELVDGVDAGTVLRRRGPLPASLLAVVAHDLAAALEAVHGAGLVHRDVTPGNLVITRAGVGKLTDLGTARIVDADGVDRVTRTGIVVGTVDYLAPEQLSPDPVGPGADVYAVGLVLRTLATGRRPFGGGTVAERAARRLTEDAPAPTEVEDWVAALVTACARRDPDRRPADGAALAALVAATAPTPTEQDRAALATLVAAAADDPVADDALDVDAPDEDDTAEQPSGRDETVVLELDADRTVAIPSTTPSQDVTTAVPVTGDAPRATDGTRRGFGLGWALLLLVLAVGAGVLLADGGGLPGGGQAVAVVDVTDHDPFGDDGRENPGAVDRVLDDDPASAWETVGYASADLGGLKPGVGLVLDLGGRTGVRAVELVLPVEGVTVEAWVSAEAPTGAPADAAGAGLVGRATDAGGTVTLDDDRVEGRWVTLWFTTLGGPADDGRFRAEVADVEVRG